MGSAMFRGALVAALIVVTSTARAQPLPQLTLDWQAIADRLVAQLAVQPGETVLLVAASGLFGDLVPPLR